MEFCSPAARNRKFCYSSISLMKLIKIWNILNPSNKILVNSNNTSNNLITKLNDNFKNYLKKDNTYWAWIDILKIKAKKANKPELITELIKIEKETEYYLLLDVRHPSKDEIVVVIFSKKNKFIDYKIITEFNDENRSSKMYGKSLNINREPSFLVEENKLGDDNALTYEKKGWAYTDSSFRLIYFDSNKKPETQKVINPLDTMSMNYTYSGDYARDNKNFISLRDYATQNKYQFFLHFEKQNGSCTGELKGILHFTKNQATYTEKGDPCIIHFTIQGNVINIKEDGNCGNHRNMTCYFNDSYDKKRKVKKKK